MKKSEVTTHVVWIAFKQCILLLGIVFFVHFLVLKFIYPGYYHPLWPNHDDFYMPIAVAHSPSNIISLLRYPRAVGMIFFDIIGNLGLHGSIFAVLFLIALNCVLTAEIFRRFIGVENNIIYLFSFFIYLFLLFSQPHFYVFSNHDAFSQLSFTLLVASLWTLSKINVERKPWLLAISLSFATLGFLTKETYGISALLLAFIWFFDKRKNGWINAITPAAIIGTALAAALFINFINRSPFTSGSSTLDAPYHIVIEPFSIAKEWLRYANEGLNPLTIGVILFCAISGAVLRKNRRYLTLSIILPIAGTFAWLPNALLPNHHFSGYSWNGAYLTFLPVIGVALMFRQHWTCRLLALAITVIAFSSPVLSNIAYKSNAWDLTQENNQRNLLKALTRLTRALPVNQDNPRVLVTGIDFPFSPFNKPYSMRMFPRTQNVSFDVVSYRSSKRKGDREAGVQFIPAKDVLLYRYQQIWAFRSDGTLTREVRHPKEFIKSFGGGIGFEASDFLIYPDLFDVFKKVINEPREKPTGGQYLKCGSALDSYNNLVGAVACLKLSMKAMPLNPYPYFYLGKIQQRQGATEAARISYEKAISLDTSEAPNPFFRRALQQAELDQSTSKK